MRNMAMQWLAAAFCSTLFGSAVPAQYSPAYIESRIEGLEREVRQLKAADGMAGGAQSVANLEVRMVQLEENMRQLQGQVEELLHRINRANDAFIRSEADMSFRLEALEQRLPDHVDAMPAPDAAMMPDAEIPAASSPTQPMPAPAPGMPTMTSGDEMPLNQQAAAPVSAGAVTYRTPREHYNAAFQLLSQARFEDARAALESFIAGYPTDPLISNAYYWLGETFYVERDYLAAADTFRRGFEMAPGGAKAPDNLLKLGMSLATMNKEEEACVVYGQLVERYPDAGSSIASKVRAERQRLNCP